MGTYRKEWECCNSATETDGWEPDSCPFCTPVAEKEPMPVEYFEDDGRIKVGDRVAVRKLTPCCDKGVLGTEFVVGEIYRNHTAICPHCRETHRGVAVVTFLGEEIEDGVVLFSRLEKI